MNEFADSVEKNFQIYTIYNVLIYIWYFPIADLEIEKNATT